MEGEGLMAGGGAAGRGRLQEKRRWLWENMLWENRCYGGGGQVIEEGLIIGEGQVEEERSRKEGKDVQIRGVWRG